MTFFEKIKNCDYSLNDNEFKNISKDTKDLLKQCLQANPYKRISAEKALSHECFKQLNKETQNVEQIYQKKNSLYDPVISNLTHLKRRLTFQKAIIKFQLNSLKIITF